MRIIIGDKIFPSLYDEILSQYPYAVVVYSQQASLYGLLVTSSPALYSTCANGDITLESLEPGFAICMLTAALGSQIWESEDGLHSTTERLISSLGNVADDHSLSTVLWANYDIEKATKGAAGELPVATGEIFFKDNSNVQYPPVSQEVLALQEEYPYVSIMHINMVIMEMYSIVASKQPLVYMTMDKCPPGTFTAEMLTLNGALALDTSNVNTIGDAMVYSRPVGIANEVWKLEDTPFESAFIFPVGTTFVENLNTNVAYELVYSNHDVKTVESLNADDGTYVLNNEVYFANCDYAPTYFMAYTWFKEMADIIRDKTATEDQMPPEEMPAILRNAKTVQPKASLLSSSIDTDGSVYNDCGYKAGYRIDSSGAVIDYEGYSTSGFMSCKTGDIVSMEGIRMVSGESDSGNLRIAFYDETKTFIALTTATGAKEHLSAIYGDDGNIIQFVIKDFDGHSVENVAYFRVCSTQLDNFSVVNVGLNLSDGSGGGDTEKYAFTDYSYFFFNGVRLEALNYIDTHNSTNFEQMFRNCITLTTIPEIDTSKGTNFTHMFNGCTALTSIPKIDTHNGCEFRETFRSCANLITIPEIDVSNGTTFNTMFGNCTKLTYIPNLNTSKGTDFNNMFSLCTSLTSIAGLDTSNGTTFSGTFSNCNVITSVPELDTSNGTNFHTMFSQCYELTSVPELDTSNGTNFYNMFYNCRKLTSIPKIDLDKGNSVTGMFSDCRSLTDLYVYNIRKAIYIGSGTSWGHLLTVDSLVHTIKELCTVTSSTSLSMGSANLEKIANLYCRITDDTTEKIEMELCESTDEGAMTLSEYASLKNWTFA